MSFLSLDRFYKWVVHLDSKLLCVWNVNGLLHFAHWFLHYRICHCDFHLLLFFLFVVFAFIGFIGFTLKELISILQILSNELDLSENTSLLLLDCPPVPDPSGSADRAVAPQKRKVSSPTHSSNGHSPSDTSPSPIKKKKKPGAVNNSSKDQVGPGSIFFLNLLCPHRMWGMLLAVTKSLSFNTGKCS